MRSFTGKGWSLEPDRGRARGSGTIISDGCIFNV